LSFLHLHIVELSRGHFYFAERGHYHFAATARPDESGGCTQLVFEYSAETFLSAEVSQVMLTRPLADGSLRLWLALGHDVERHRSTDEILQGRLIELLAFVDVDGAPDISVQAGVEET
jgi:hypothetical protein